MRLSSLFTPHSSLLTPHLFLFMLLVPIGMSAQSVEGTSYTLPKNGIRFTVRVEKTQYTPGRFCQYAERYLKKNVGQESATTYRVVSIDADQMAMPDTSKRFTLVVDKKHTITKVTCSPGGQLLAINADAATATLPERKFTPAPKPEPLNPNDFMTEDILNAGSTAKMAELTAKEIYDIRDSRNSLSRGEADNLPKDGAQLKLMYDNMNRQEQALSQLFYGTTTKDTTQAQMDFWPAKEGQDILFRFSKYYGLVDSDDLSGEPYYINVADLHTAKAPVVSEEEKKKEDKGDIGLRVNVPGKIKVVVANGEKPVKQLEMNAAQFGYVESLSGELFGKKQTSEIVLDPLTGGVKSIKAVTLKD